MLSLLLNLSVYAMRQALQTERCFARQTVNIPKQSFLYNVSEAAVLQIQPRDMNIVPKSAVCTLQNTRFLQETTIPTRNATCSILMLERPERTLMNSTGAQWNNTEFTI